MILQRLRDQLPRLKGVETGAWLESVLPTLRDSPDAPRVLVLNMAPKEFRDLPPANGTDWRILSPNAGTEAMVVAADAVDAVLWCMTAMRMFSGEYETVLDTVRRNGTPVWAVVSGMKRLSDPAGFERREVPRLKSRLPTMSEIVLLGRDTRSVQEIIADLVATHGRTATEAGEARRQAATLALCRQNIAAERRRWHDLLVAATRRAENAEKGGSAIGILCRAHAARLLETVQAVIENAAGIAEVLAEAIVDQAKTLSSEQLRALVGEEFGRYRDERIMSPLDAMLADTPRMATEWITTTTTELHRFFGPLIKEAPAVAEQLALDADAIVPGVTRRTELLRKQLLEAFDGIAAAVDQDMFVQVLRLLGTEGNRLLSAAGPFSASRATRPTEETRDSLPPSSPVELWRRQTEAQQIGTVLRTAVDPAVERMRDLLTVTSADTTAFLQSTVEGRVAAGLQLGAPLQDNARETLARLMEAERQLTVLE